MFSHFFFIDFVATGGELCESKDVLFSCSIQGDFFNGLFCLDSSEFFSDFWHLWMVIRLGLWRSTSSRRCSLTAL